MSGRASLIALVALVVSPLVACTDPCLAVCEEARGCPDADLDVDCDTACAEELEKAPDCEEELDAYYACEATQVDVCEPLPELCTSEREAVVACEPAPE